MTNKKTVYAALICGLLLLSGCASTGSDSNSSAQTNSDKAQTNSNCAASGQKSYEMADGSIICY